MTTHRIRQIFIVAKEVVSPDHISCLQAGFRQVFGGFDKLQHVAEHFPLPYGAYGEANIPDLKNAFEGALVVYAGQTMLPEREWQAILKAGGYPVYGYFSAEQPESKQLTLGAHNLRHYLSLYRDHNRAWVCRPPVDTYGDWPKIVFEPAAYRAA
jgi:hypothetical protein